MTENEIKPTIEQTIYCLKAGSERYPEVCAECQLYGEVGCDHCYDDTNDMAIKCLKQLEQYRAIGTIEEFKDSKEKSVAKKPRFYAHNYYCTECGNLVGNNEFEWKRFLYCDKCGQKLDCQ